MKQEDIPADLKDLDPNNQPALNNLDNLQLLLRLTVLKQTSPASDPLVEEELSALVGRVLYASAGKVNWSIFHVPYGNGLCLKQTSLELLKEVYSK